MKTVIIENSKQMATVGKAFNDLTWVLKARSSDDTRKNMHFLEVKAGRFTCTDGHRLHTMRLLDDGLPLDQIPTDGLWEVVKIDKKNIVIRESEEGCQYPDWEGTIPTKIAERKAEISMGGKTNPKGNLFRNVYRILDETETMNFNFINDMFLDGDSWTVKFYEVHAAIAFENGNKKGIVMPMRII